MVMFVLLVAHTGVIKRHLLREAALALPPRSCLAAEADAVHILHWRLHIFCQLGSSAHHPSTTNCHWAGVRARTNHAPGAVVQDAMPRKLLTTKEHEELMATAMAAAESKGKGDAAAAAAAAAMAAAQSKGKGAAIMSPSPSLSPSPSPSPEPSPAPQPVRSGVFVVHPDVSCMLAVLTV